jgi:hypothetical protein
VMALAGFLGESDVGFARNCQSSIKPGRSSLVNGAACRECQLSGSKHPHEGQLRVDSVEEVGDEAVDPLAPKRLD